MTDKKPRTDKRKNVGKVAEKLVENPNLTTREIAQATGLSIGAVHNSKKEVEQSGTKDETIAYIVNKSKERIKKAQAYFDRFIDEATATDELDKEKTKIITTIVKDDLQRVTVLGGNVTDDKGGFDLKNATTDELLAFIRGK